MNIYVGNLANEVTDADLTAAFTPFGKVNAARVITDRFSGRTRGFGFVEMPTTSEAQAAMQALNGKELKGRSLVVNEARPRNEGGRRADRRGGPRW
ncbi:MAG: RNA-binding protein [Chloroflexi bacterium]|nr:RNA-binding protein [Chloroflexota bacterium]